MFNFDDSLTLRRIIRILYSLVLFLKIKMRLFNAK